jgi:branched-chain amino acid transport system ATP-binding protein
VIEIKDLVAGYGNTDVLKNLSLSFEKGKLTTVIGPNGSGKSTVLKTTLGILPRTSGNIFID